MYEALKSRRILTALALGLGTLTLTNCSALEGPGDPEKGIVVDKQVNKVNGSCIYRKKGICYAYVKVEEHTLTIAGCKALQGSSVELADDKYLEQAQMYPSDYPVTDVGEVEVNNDNTVSCGIDIVVDFEQYEEIGIGDKVVVSDLK